MQLAQETDAGEQGFAMAALLVSIAVMAVVLSALLPVWRTLSTREKEAELLWRGEQYDRAIQLYRKKNAAPGPPSLDVLIKGRYLRKAFKDPITGDDFELIPVNAGLPNAPGAQQPPRGFGQLIGGVRSKSKAKSFAEPGGATTYAEWTFSYTPWQPGGQVTAPQGAGGMPGTVGGVGAGGRGVGSRGAGRGQGPGAGGTPGRGPGSRVVFPGGGQTPQGPRPGGPGGGPQP
jgi:type II secretory pathway pseudopilin PulG